jgi:hypothetical protein
LLDTKLHINKINSMFAGHSPYGEIHSNTQSERNVYAYDTIYQLYL